MSGWRRAGAWSSGAVITLFGGLAMLPGCNRGMSLPAAESGAICRNLTPGETQAVDHTLTTLSARYYLTRNDDVNGHAVYHAVIPVTFLDYGSNTRSSLTEEIFNRANTCLEQAEPYLNGPASETLSVRLVPPVKDGMGAFQIEVSRGLRRGDSQHWDANWGCPEITHEVMHLMGLVDENHEMELVEGNTYDCRAVGPHDSLMSDPHRAYNAASPLVQSVECNCDGISDQACPAALADLAKAPGAPAQCPPSTHEQVYQSTSEWIEASFPPSTRWPIATAEHYRFLRRGTPARASLLFPAEFNAIVAPGCQDRNRVYYACAGNAYRSSQVGRGCLTDLPAECSGDGWVREGRP